MYSCQKDDEINPQAEEQQVQTEGLIKLGEKLENPYSVENMQKALGNLKSSKVSAKSSSGNDIEITTTHLYLRFKPNNEDELNILKADSTFVLYDYPLDYEIKENGYFYKDPEVTGDQPTYQYCAIPVDKKLPDGLEHELLANLFIPDEDSDDGTDSKTSSKSYSPDLVDALVDEALRITNNLDENSTKGKSSLAARRSKWTPAGTIKVWDDVLNTFIGVEGVQVRARRWFTTHRGFVNADGSYSCDGRFRRDANYSIDWERYEFALQDGWLNGATYNGPKIRGNWDLNLKDDKQEYYATIFRAAHHYYYKEIKGLRRPPQNSFWRTQLKIRAYLENERSNHKEERRFLGSQIHMKAYERSSQEIYETTIHELAHASHWNMWRNQDDFDDTDKIVKESWALGVQQELTRMVYPNRNPTYGRLNYTEIVEDLIDPNKTRTTSYWYDFNTNTWCTSSQRITRTYNDNVSGYNIKQLEDALRGKLTWDSWRNNIKTMYNINTATNTNIDNAFTYWNTK